jgi:hypothetical protein
MIDSAACVEARITGISLSGEAKSVAITLWRESTGFTTLTGLGVERLLVNEFREQNVVDRVVLWDAAADPDEYRQSLGTLISGGGENEMVAAFLPLIENEIACILSGQKVFVEIEPVYGASITFLSKKVTFARAPDPAAGY